jgi:hypothetical protein
MNSWAAINRGAYPSAMNDLRDDRGAAEARLRQRRVEGATLIVNAIGTPVKFSY